MDEPLERYDGSDLRSVLAVVAHPDDMEYGGSAAVATWTDRGVAVSYALVTRGEAGMDSTPPEDAGPLREREQRAACAAVGVEDPVFLGFDDGTVTYSLALRAAIAEQVRRVRPELVVTINGEDRWPWGAPNQADHVAVGRAVLDAVRDAGNRWVFRDQLGGGLEPWDGVREVLVLNSSRPTHAVVVEDTVDAAVASLEAHAAYLAALGDGTTSAREVVEGILTWGAERVPDARYAVVAERVPMS